MCRKETAMGPEDFIIQPSFHQMKTTKTYHKKISEGLPVNMENGPFGPFRDSLSSKNGDLFYSYVKYLVILHSYGKWRCIVSSPIKNGDFAYLCKRVPEVEFYKIPLDPIKPT